MQSEAEIRAAGPSNQGSRERKGGRRTEGYSSTWRRLTFSCQQGPHVIWLCVVGIVQDEILHNDAIGLHRWAPVHLDSVGVERVQPQVRRRSGGPWQRQTKSQPEQQEEEQSVHPQRASQHGLKVVRAPRGSEITSLRGTLGGI